MAEITASLVKELRERTGSGMMDCKKALKECEGDLDKAVAHLRKKGLSDAAKKSSRLASEGVIESYIHGGGKIGVILEVNCETDFVSKNEDFRQFCKDTAMLICANNPKFVNVEDVDASVVEAERKIYLEKASEQGKPANIVEKIVEGQINKYLESICLMTQPSLRDDKVTVEKQLAELVAKIGENIKVRRFVRFELGEGLEKKEENFADEVMKQIEDSKK